MAEIVSLNQFRKAKTLKEAAKTARENRIKFGRTKADKNKNKALREQRKRELDGKEITDSSED
ncbi:MAG TPA: DUF4169 family protein [Magnetovibrio sp.]